MGHRQNGEGKAGRTAELVNASSVSIEQAIRVASETRAGTVVEAKLKKKLKKVVWRVKLLTEHGQVKLFVDGSSGTIIATEADLQYDPPTTPLTEVAESLL